jgi:ubiquinone/menaquinone biosynthesis C-methylase UbiE
MNINPLDIKDTCRKNLLKYLNLAVSALPTVKNPIMLDVGCGTGVPTLFMIQQMHSTVYAVDIDQKVLDHLRRKINSLNLEDRIKIYRESVFDMSFPEKYFDIILAEGLLNITGFEQGLILLDKFIKEKGFMIVHDEYRDHDKKLKIMNRFGYRLIHSVLLDEHVWWNEYYRCLDRKLRTLDKEILSEKFKNEIREISQYRENPTLFRSVYYVLKKVLSEQTGAIINT